MGNNGLGRRIVRLGIVGLIVAAGYEGGPSALAGGAPASHTLTVQNSTYYPISAYAYNNDDTEAVTGTGISAQHVDLIKGRSATVKCSSNGSCRIGVRLIEGGGVLGPYQFLGDFSRCVRVGQTQVNSNGVATGGAC